jgi:hypothetical protein
MKQIEPLSVKLVRWMGYGWLFLTDLTFKDAPDKRRAYYEYRLSRFYNTPCY